MHLIFHITQRQQWQAAQEQGVYHGESLDTEGFIHCSTLPQVIKVANLFFAGQSELVLLGIDADRLQAELRYDPVEGGESFPHVYGALNLEAIGPVYDFEPQPDGTFELPPALFWSILNDEIDDAMVNQLVWQCLGYRYDPAIEQWDATAVAAEWREAYPTPPDFIASRPATVQLTRSIPPENKQLLKTELGFAGYKLDQLVPRQTRRATSVNWLLSYRKQTAALE